MALLVTRRLSGWAAFSQHGKVILLDVSAVHGDQVLNIKSIMERKGFVWRFRQTWACDLQFTQAFKNYFAAKHQDR